VKLYYNVIIRIYLTSVPDPGELISWCCQNLSSLLLKVKVICWYYYFWSGISPNPPGICPWTLLGDLRPPVPFIPQPPTAGDATDR